MPISQPLTPHRARPPQPPASTPTPQQQLREATRLDALLARLRLEQRSLLRGLILLALVVLIASLAHAGFSRLFVPGWWRQW